MNNLNKNKALLALEDGKYFFCKSFANNGEVFGEIVFNTSMTGYQEVLTDPSYTGQIVTMTYPLIGNYGINDFDIESSKIQVSGFIVREYQEFPSNFISKMSLCDYLKSENIIAVDDLDTRALTRHIRISGAMRAGISTIDLDPESLINKIHKSPKMAGQDLVKIISKHKPYRFVNGKPQEDNIKYDKNIFKFRGKKHCVVAFDYGIKYNILRCLEMIDSEIIVVPASTNWQLIKDMEPDGIFLSNGPGDPEPVKYAIETIKNLIGYRPIFGICLGHQLLGLALGGKTYKLKFGHRGANQPVTNLKTSKVEITSQNHGFALEINSLNKKDIEITHINLNDNTLEGFCHKTYPIFSVQYHPEASPGPHDAHYLFKDFKKLMEK